MEVTIAARAGFCGGVERALAVVDKAIAGARGRTVVTLGPIIHNREVVRSLRARGVETVERPPAGSVAVVRAHGLAKGALKFEKGSRIAIRDGTCPYVARVQRAVADAASDGRLVVLVGDRDHIEIRNAVTYANGHCVVVRDAEEVSGIETALGRVAVVAQTTLDRETFDRVVSAARARWGEVVVCDTVCADSKARQSEATTLAREADVVIVVGGRESANTARLVALAGAIQPRTHLVETSTEVNRSWFHLTERVLVVSGASTPIVAVERVVEMLRGLFR